MKLFTKTWVNDLTWLKWAFRSVYKYCDEQVIWHVVGENNICDEIRRMTEECAEKSNNSYGNQIIVHNLDPWPEVASINDNYMGQQWIKMMAHKVVGDDLVWNWDSDVFARNHFKETDFLGKDNKPIYWFSKLNRFKGTNDYPVLRQRANLLEKIFTHKPITNEWMRCMPIPLVGSILKAGAKTTIWDGCYRACARGNRAFSEFNAIGQYASMHFHDSFDWREPEVSGPTWAGSAQAGENMEKRPGVDIVFQNWSWGGETPEIKAWIEKEFGAK